MSEEIKLVTIRAAFDNAKIRNMMRELHRVLENGVHKTGFVLTVSGWDDDPRDVWQIPECVDLFKRLVELGFISLLEVSTHAKDIAQIPDCGGLGALEIWLMSQGKVTVGDSSIDRRTMGLFMKEMDIANIKCRKVAASEEQLRDWRDVIDPELN